MEEPTLPEPRFRDVELHEAVTPLGSPETARLTGPWKDPPPVKVKVSVILIPCERVTWVEDGELFNVGATNVT